jgi:3-hydroxyacyl-CoA dehydrogenase/enoyl-CoA hydratase/3-hydroxybutyryl-CoA epimerase
MQSRPALDLTEFRFDAGDDGVAVLIWDTPGRSMNVIGERAIDELEAVLARVVEDAAIAGVVVVSAKAEFSGGADLALIERLIADYRATAPADAVAAATALLERSRRLSGLYRRIETCGKPWVVAIAGRCLGGALELALAAHARLAADDGATRIGLPEVKVGLFPGAGGTQRILRMLDPERALKVLTGGREHAAAEAVALGLVDRVVPRERLVDEARAMIVAGVEAVKPWDRAGFRPPGGGGPYSPAGYRFWPAALAQYRRQTSDNLPAVRLLMRAAFEGLQLPMDRALAVESRLFAEVLAGPEAAAMIRTLFTAKRALDRLVRRPAGVPERLPDRVGVVGAGFMGSAIAAALSLAGFEVVLVDRDAATAARGREAAVAGLAERVRTRHLEGAAAEAAMRRLAAGDGIAALAGAGLVIEAVFEDAGTKCAALAAVAEVVSDEAVIATNTSALPLAGLADAIVRPARFLGLHFFSPVDRMRLVEVIRARDTDDAALALALDVVGCLGKTPIVVADGRGFYASRVVGTYVGEGVRMLREGVPPAMVETVGRLAGMPTGPLALADEVGLDVAWRVTEAALAGGGLSDDPVAQVLSALVPERGRLGRKGGAGFYDYPAGGRKGLWPGLAEIVGRPRPAETFRVEGLKVRLLTVQALETVRALDEGVVADAREADVGSVFGFGFPAFTGGTASYVDGVGIARFTALCEELADRHGERFRPPGALAELAAGGGSLHGRFRSA